MPPVPTIYLVDDNNIHLECLQSCLTGRDYNIKSFDSAEAFLHCLPVELPGCLLLDNMMPGLTGVEMYEGNADRLTNLPVIFMSGDSSYEDVFRATRYGATAFLQKPIAKERLLTIVADAVTLSRELIARHDSVQEDQARFDSLTEREQEVFRLLVDGAPNKLIARKLDIALRTVEYHRANILKKLDKTLLVELIALSKRIRC